MKPSDKGLLTEKEKERAFSNYPCLDPSFEEDYKSEVATLLQAQHEKSFAASRAEAAREIFEEIDKLSYLDVDDETSEPNGLVAMWDDDYQSLKARFGIK